MTQTRVALYARVSTIDKEQDPETQLGPLREFVAAQAGWTVVSEFVDRAPATDLRGRTAWRTLMDTAARRRVDVVLCWKLDRCFRSVMHASTTLEQYLYMSRLTTLDVISPASSSRSPPHTGGQPPRRRPPAP